MLASISLALARSGFSLGTGFSALMTAERREDLAQGAFELVQGLRGILIRTGERAFEPLEIAVQAATLPACCRVQGCWVLAGEPAVEELP